MGEYVVVHEALEVLLVWVLWASCLFSSAHPVATTEEGDQGMGIQNLDPH